MKAGEIAGKPARLNSHEQRAFKKLKLEAKRAGSTLANSGKGGLRPSLVLGAMRRDEFKCKKCGGRENISVHHVAHVENPTPGMSDKDPSGHREKDIVTMCASCHDELHEEDREKTEAKKND